MEHRHNAPNSRVGLYYAVGAALAALVAVWGWPWTGVAIWPALSLAIVAVGYFGAGPRIYGKRDGRLSRRTLLLMAPSLLGQHLSLTHYRAQCNAWDEAIPGLLIGRVLTDREAGDLIRLGVTAVLDLTAEFTEPARLRALHYRNLPILDLTAPTMAQLRDAVVFIDEQLAGGGTVYVHCKVGYSRTAAMVGAYLMASGACKTVDAAMMHLRAARPPIVIRPEAVAAMQQFCQARLPP